MNDRWRDVPGFEGLYEVSRGGRVRSLKREGTPGRVLKTTPGGRQGRYLRVELWREHKRIKLSVHRVVLQAFRGIPPPDMCEGAHLDNNPSNNRLSNLCWATRADNVAMIHGRLEGEDVAEREAIRLEALDHTQPFVADPTNGCPF